MLAPLRSRPFRYLVIGSTVSRLGNAIAPVALAFAVLDLTGSAPSLGIVVGARSLANVIFLLLGFVLGAEAVGFLIGGLFAMRCGCTGSCSSA